MSDEEIPKVWMEYKDLNVGARGSTDDDIEDVQAVFEEVLENVVETISNFDEDVDHQGWE